MSKYYAVKKGVKTGVFDSWAKCEPLVKGYPCAIYKAFTSEKAAEDFLEKKEPFQAGKKTGTPQKHQKLQMAQIWSVWHVGFDRL